MTDIDSCRVPDWYINKSASSSPLTTSAIISEMEKNQESNNNSSSCHDQWQGSFYNDSLLPSAPCQGMTNHLRNSAGYTNDYHQLHQLYTPHTGTITDSVNDHSSPEQPNHHHHHHQQQYHHSHNHHNHYHHQQQQENGYTPSSPNSSNEHGSPHQHTFPTVHESGVAYDLSAPYDHILQQQQQQHHHTSGGQYIQRQQDIQFHHPPTYQKTYNEHGESLQPLPSYNYINQPSFTYNDHPSDESPNDGGGYHSSGEDDKARKRPREADVDISGDVILGKEQVLQLSSKQIEDYVFHLKQKHILSPSEEKELKKQRRLIKNREYASQSRNRRKAYVDNVVGQLEQTETEVRSIKQQLTSLQTENRELKKKINSFTQVLQNNPALADAFGKIFTFGKADSKKTATNLALFVFFCIFTFTFLLPLQPLSPLQITKGKSYVQRSLLHHADPIEAINSFSLFDSTPSVILEESKGLVNKLFSLSLFSKDIPAPPSMTVPTTTSSNSTTVDTNPSSSSSINVNQPIDSSPVSIHQTLFNSHLLDNSNDNHQLLSDDNDNECTVTSTLIQPNN